MYVEESIECITTKMKFTIFIDAKYLIGVNVNPKISFMATLLYVTLH